MLGCLALLSRGHWRRHPKKVADFKPDTPSQASCTPQVWGGGWKSLPRQSAHRSLQRLQAGLKLFFFVEGRGGGVVLVIFCCFCPGLALFFPLFLGLAGPEVLWSYMWIQ